QRRSRCATDLSPTREANRSPYFCRVPGLLPPTQPCVTNCASELPDSRLDRFSNNSQPSKCSTSTSQPLMGVGLSFADIPRPTNYRSSSSDNSRSNCPFKLPPESHPVARSNPCHLRPFCSEDLLISLLYL